MDRIDRGELTGIMDINNIYCVGRNYGLHAAELGNEVPDSPMIFMKPTHSAFAMDGGELRLPASCGTIHYEAELVVRMAGAYEPGIATADLVADFALGLDLTLRDLQTELKKQQHPWLKAKGFLRAAPMTGFHPVPPGDGLSRTEFSFAVNGEERQRGKLADAIFSLSTLIEHIGRHYGLGQGDLIFTGTPAGVGELRDGDKLELFWNGNPLGSCRVSLAE